MKALSLVAFALLGLACAWHDEVLRPEGASAEITDTGGRKYNAELLAVKDSALLLLKDTIVQVPLNSINTLKLKNVDRSLGWAPVVVICEGVPSLIMIAGMEDKGPGFVGVVVTLVTWMLMDEGTPQVDFVHPFKSSDLELLRLYVRYPQGLTMEQVHRIELQRDTVRTSEPRIR